MLIYLNNIVCQADLSYNLLRLELQNWTDGPTQRIASRSKYFVRMLTSNQPFIINIYLIFHVSSVEYNF